MEYLIKRDSSFYTGYLQLNAIAEISGEESMSSEVLHVDIIPSTFTVDITTTSNSVRYVAKEGTTIIRDVMIPLASIKAHHRISSQSFWSFIVNDSTAKTLAKEDCYYLLDNSYFTKRPAWRYIKEDSILGLKLPNQDNHLPFDLFLKSELSDFNAAALILNIDTFNTFIIKINGTVIDTSTLPTPVSNKEIFSTIALSTTDTPVAGDIITVNVTSSHTELDYIELEADAGILDRTRVKLTNGSGSFKILTSTFTAGEVIKCHAGVKRFTKLATFSVTLA